MTVNAAINDIAKAIKEEIVTEVDLSIGTHEDPAQTSATISERIDKILAMMDFQSSKITAAENVVEEMQYQYRRKELAAKTKYNHAFINFKSEDRLKPKDQRRTDKEYEAMAELESNIEVSESLSAHKAYVSAQHKLDDEKHNYEILEAHFTGYKKQAELLMRELSRFGDGTMYKKY
jgi:hypothetical protein